MPTYQYACTDCGDKSEVVQRFTDDPLTVCVVCGGKLRKVFSPVGIVFKGSGFYRTDSRNGSSVAAGKESAASGSNGSGSDSAAGTSSSSSSSESSGSGSDSSATSDKKSAGDKKSSVAASSPAT